jgi:alanyl-tRNA synthetase
LSAACEKLLNANTVSFHLGDELCTIDLDVPRIPLEAVQPVEDLVNQVIWEDRPVTARFVDPERLVGLTLRRPPQVEGLVRLVEVGAGREGCPFDVNPCGGTHVARTGEIGLLKVLRLDYRGQETRVEFLCGGRALRDYRLKNRTALRLAAELTVGHWELEEAVGRLQDDLKVARRELRAARERAVEEEAARLAQLATSSGALRIVQVVWEGRNAAELRALARAVTALPGTVALLASLDQRTHVCVACAEDADVDADEIVRGICEPLGGRGGGKRHLAQGSAPPADRNRVEELLTHLAAGL